ncbi:MAG: YqhA family protein [Gloeobacterales cyanobacterium]
MLSRILASSRYLILIAVLGSLGAFIALLISGALQIGLIVFSAITKPNISSKGLKALSLSFIEIIDIFLLATVFYIIALGLYELFIDASLELPGWLSIQDLDDLKNKLASVVIVVLGVLFLGQALEWKGNDILPYGVAVALVIAALTYFLSQKGKKSKSE